MIRSIFCGFVLLLAIVANAQEDVCENCWIRTELYFGLSIPSGGKVKKSEWKKFMKEQVTPLFSDGSTVIEARGQWLDSNTNQTINEKSKVLIVLYPVGEHEKRDQDLKAISDYYIKTFEQQSVMRVDAFANVQFY